MSYTLKQYFEEAQVPEIPEWFSEITIRHRTIKDFRPRWEQVTGLNMMFTFPNLRCGIFDEQGTGKTLPAQAFAIWQAAQSNGCVCLMPRTLLRQFEGSLYQTFPGIEKYIRAEIYHGNQKKRDEQVGRWAEYGAPQIVLTSYLIFMKEFMLFRHFNFNAMVADEAKILANPKSKTFVAIEKFLDDAGSRYFVALNGTPSGNTLKDCYGNIEMITPGTYPSEADFDQHHIIYKRIAVRVHNKGVNRPQKMRDVDVIEDYAELDMLSNNLYKQARRVEKSTLNLPPLVEIPVPFDLSEEHQAAYDQFVTERLLEFTDGTILDGTTSSGLRTAAFQSVIRPELLGIHEPSLIFELYEELIQGVGINTTKVFMLAHYQKTVEAMRDYFKKYNPAVIYGKTKDPEAQKKKFMNDDTCRLLIGNWESAGVGLDGMQDVCFTGIAAEPTTVPKQYVQARDRIHRSGQVNPVHWYFPIARNTVYVKAARDLRRKRDWIDTVVSVGQLRDELTGADGEIELDEAA